MQTTEIISGCVTFLNGALVTAITEAELVALKNWIQDMLYIRNILESMGLKMKLP
jgi:hypothetical protein